MVYNLGMSILGKIDIQNFMETTEIFLEYSPRPSIWLQILALIIWLFLI